MKGIVFTEFIALVEDKFGLEVADTVLGACPLDSGGAYTAVGTYDHGEILQLVSKLSDVTGVDVPTLVETFGQHLFGTLATAHPSFLQEVGGTFDFLERIDNHIHVEVRKLYPDAELPTFKFRRDGDDRFEMAYRSSRPFAHLAVGLIRGCAGHFGEDIDIEHIDESGGVGNAATFILNRKAAA